MLLHLSSQERFLDFHFILYFYPPRVVGATRNPLHTHSRENTVERTVRSCEGAKPPEHVGKEPFRIQIEPWVERGESGISNY